MDPVEKKGNVKTLTALGIPVEIFIIFLVENKQDLTVTDVITMFTDKYKVELPYNRMKQILDTFCEMDKLKKDTRPFGKRNKLTTFYSFNRIV